MKMVMAVERTRWSNWEQAVEMRRGGIVRMRKFIRGKALARRRRKACWERRRGC